MVGNEGPWYFGAINSPDSSALFHFWSTNLPRSRLACCNVVLHSKKVMDDHCALFAHDNAEADAKEYLKLRDNGGPHTPKGPSIHPTCSLSTTRVLIKVPDMMSLKQFYPKPADQAKGNT